MIDGPSTVGVNTFFGGYNFGFSSHQCSRLIKKVTTLALGLLGSSFLPTNSAFAAEPAFGEFRINNNTLNAQLYPAIAALQGGGFVVAWHGGQTGDDDIYSQMYDASGALHGLEFRANNNTMNNQQYPALAALNNGGFVLVWHGDQTGDDDIYGQIHDVSGTKVGSEFRVNDNTMSSQQFPAIAALKNGGFAVVWQGFQSGNWDIFCRTFTALGVPLEVDFLANTVTANTQTNPAITGLDDGGMVVVWDGGQVTNYEIYGQRYNASRSAVGVEFQANSVTTQGQQRPTVSSWGNGGFVVAWEGGQSGKFDISGQKYIETPSGSEFVINTDTTDSQARPNIAPLEGGGLVTVWQGIQSGAWDIYGQRFDATGAPTGTEFSVNTNTNGAQENPAVAGIPGGGFVVVWMSDQTGNSDIYGQRFDVNGAPISNSSLPSSSMVMGSPTPSSSFQAPQPLPAPFASSLNSPTPSPTPSSMSESQVGSSSAQIPQPLPAPFASSLNSPTPSSVSESQVGSSSAQIPQPLPAPFASSLNNPTPSSTPSSMSESQVGSSNAQIPQPLPAPTASSLNNPTPSSMSESQVGSSSAQIPQPLSAPSASSPTPSPSSMSESQVGSSSVQASSYSSHPSTISGTSLSSRGSYIFSITQIIYGEVYFINLLGGSVGTFTITGGLGKYDSTQSNILTINLNPDADLAGETLILFEVAQDQGSFQSIVFEGTSCYELHGEVVKDDESRKEVFKVFLANTICATGAKPEATFFPKMMVRV